MPVGSGYFRNPFGGQYSDADVGDIINAVNYPVEWAKIGNNPVPLTRRYRVISWEKRGKKMKREMLALLIALILYAKDIKKFSVLLLRECEA